MSGSEVDGMSHAKTDASSHANTDASSRSNADPMSRSAELARSDAAPTAPARSDATAQATSLFERGYAVFEHLRAPHEVARLRAALDAERARLDPPALYAPESRPLDDDAFLTTSGLALPRFLPRHPALFPLVLDPRLLAALRQLLGPLRLELAGGMISDPSRPFFRWHTHIDGEDEGERVRRQAWPAQRAPRRVLAILYLDDLDADGGPLLVHPRRVGDPTEPPHPIDQTRWPGDVKLTFPAGSVLLLEQCVWHAVLPRQAPGLRYFVGGYFASAEAPPTELVDESLQTLQTDDPLLSSVLPGR